MMAGPAVLLSYMTVPHITADNPQIAVRRRSLRRALPHASRAVQLNLQNASGRGVRHCDLVDFPNELWRVSAVGSW
jgi:hypothetical protein